MGFVMKEWLVVRRPPPTRSGGLEFGEPTAKTVSATELGLDDKPKVGLEQAGTRDDLPDRHEIAAQPMPVSLIAPIMAEPGATEKILVKTKEAGAPGACARWASIRNDTTAPACRSRSSTPE